MIPSTTVLDAAALDVAMSHDSVVQRYRAFFTLLDWSQVPERLEERPWPGSPPHPERADLKALLVKLVEQKASITDLRKYLTDHPLLVLELGFHPVLDPSQPNGFAVDATVPGDRWLRHKQQTLDNTIIQALLQETVHALQHEIPDLGTTIAIDVKHIYAWVVENNLKAYVTERYDPKRQPQGDPDCRLGVKRSTNQERPDGSVKERKEYV